MNKIFQILCLVIFGISYSQINVEEIKKNATENPGTYFYDYLEIFKKDPSKLTQEQLNQLYYGSRFVKSEYEISDYNQDYEKIWKFVKKRMSKSKAKMIVAKAEEAYSKNPLEKELLNKMSYIYNALDENIKRDLCNSQYYAIIETIDKSGTGESEDSPICVIRAGDMISKIGDLAAYGTRGGLDQKMKTLPDGSLLTTYSIGDKKVVVKLVGGFR